MRVEHINSFEQTDEDEFTLVALTEIGLCVLIMDTHTAAELHDRLVKEIGEHIFERDSARTTLPPEPSDEEPEPGESPLNFYRRTGNTDAILDYADRLCKVMKESR